MTQSRTSKPRAMHAAPFASRAYGGFSQAQAQFISEVIPNRRGLTILDPMCGQALLAASWSHEGADVFLADVNPGPLALAALRAPHLITRRKQYASRLRDLITGLFLKSETQSADVAPWPDDGNASTDWLPNGIRLDLAILGERLGLRTSSDITRAFSVRDSFQRFTIGICALASRRIATFRLSDNLTWLRPGGLKPATGLPAALTAALDEWTQWAQTISLSHPQGALTIRLSSAVDCEFKTKADVIITSPPYANRLDYKRMWAPETAVVLALVRTSLADLSPFIGTNKKRNPAEDDLRRLSRSVRSALRHIRSHNAWASASYYYPFFAAYALDLDSACKHMAQMMRRRGLAIVFGRDTVRKDTVFPTIDVVNHAMRSSKCDVIKRERAIIRSHIGNMRPVTEVGLYGKAQREWWLVFRRR